MEKLVINAVVTFFLNALTSWESAVDWVGLQAKLDQHINAFFPIKSMDAGLIAFAALLFKAIQTILSEQTQLAALMVDIENNNYKGALAQFESMLVTAVPALKGVL